MAVDLFARRTCPLIHTSHSISILLRSFASVGLRWRALILATASIVALSSCSNGKFQWTNSPPTIDASHIISTPASDGSGTMIVSIPGSGLIQNAEGYRWKSELRGQQCYFHPDNLPAFPGTSH